MNQRKNSLSPQERPRNSKQREFVTSEKLTEDKIHTMGITAYRVLFTCLLLAVIPAVSIFASFQQGYDLYKRGKYYEAEEVLLREKELSPGNLDVYAVLGWCYLNTGRYKDAIDISNEGLKINAGDTRFLTTIGRAYLELKRYTDALTYLKRSITLNPDYSYNYFYAGRVYLNQGKYILAETAFSAAIKLQSDRYIFYRFRGEVYEKMANYRAAEEDYKEALTLKPNDPRLKESLIRVISKQTEQTAEYEE